MSYGYINKNTIILNFSKKYYKNSAELLSSYEFEKFVNLYLEYVQENENYICAYAQIEAKELVKVIRKLMFLETSEIDSKIIEDQEKFLYLIHSMYNFWKNFDRYIVVETGNDKAIQNDNFIKVTEDFQNLIRDIYRTIEEKVTKKDILVYRQLDSGAKTAISVYTFNSQKYIKNIMLRTPLLLYPKTTIRKGLFKETKIEPTNYLNRDNSYVLAVKVGQYSCHVNFHKDFISTVSALANLFEIIPQPEITENPDMILYYGNIDNNKEETFYQKGEQLIGNLSYSESLDYFGYCKKMCLTLHNLVAMNNNRLPIHGAFFNLKLKGGVEKNIMMIGDSGAGKSETIEAIQKIKSDKIEKINIIFDDMGVINQDMSAQGTEIGAFIRLDDLDIGTSYKNMDRSIFMNPDKKNARVITPVAPYHYITRNHKVDYILYANNYSEKEGFEILDNVDVIFDTFINAKRMALGTTNETGLSTTYFANPFGPVQRQDQCNKIFKSIMEKMINSDTKIGVGYTNLGTNNKNGIETLAKQIIDML